jgi:hypothetical protein
MGALLQAIEAYAFAQHYRKFLVETYASVVFAAARSFNIALGFFRSWAHCSVWMMARIW